jgi:hypothetical protein
VATGINEQSKRDLAGKRIKKLISFTQTNDGLKEQYVTDTAKLTEVIESAFATLKERTVHNTMKGAKDNLARLDTWKTNQKPEIFEMHVRDVLLRSPSWRCWDGICGLAASHSVSKQHPRVLSWF